VALASDPSAATVLRQLRHDLSNPVNVLLGVVDALLRTDLDQKQRAWAHVLASTTQRLQEIVERIDTYHSAAAVEGRERLADLCSIAAARLGKPFDRTQLISTIERVSGSSGGRILLVDDSDELAIVVHSYLEGTEWTIDMVDSGERAVAQATTERYDLVLMDIGLPGIDGATAAHAIRAADLARGASPTPVVAMTAYDPGPPVNASGDGPDAHQPDVVPRRRRT
jgi:CheY-like chemotaxis protein